MLKTRYQILNSQYLKGIQITQYSSFNLRFCCCLFLEFVLLKLHCLVFCCLAALFALFVVSPRLYLILCITLSWACVKGSGSHNKDCINQTGVRLSAAYSEKDNAVAVVTIAIVDHVINMTETDDEREHGDHGDAQPDLKVVRRQWKAAITRHLNTLQRHIAEGDVEQVRDRLNKVKVTFSELEYAHEAFQQTLTTDAEFDQSESWFADAQRSYISSINPLNNGSVMTINLSLLSPR